MAITKSAAIACASVVIFAAGDINAAARKLSAICGGALVGYMGVVRGGSTRDIAPESSGIRHNQSVPSVVSDDTCDYVLHSSKLPLNQSLPRCQDAFNQLDAFFKKEGVKDYADAAKYGSQGARFDDAEGFNGMLGAVFVENSRDVVPHAAWHYQAIVFNTSGIDVFMERLAFLSRLTREHGIKTDDIVALVSNHAHRKDLQNRTYLMKLPWLFTPDFELAPRDVSDAIFGLGQSYLKRSDWTHRVGMEVAWDLVEGDSVMAQLRKKFRYSTVAAGEHTVHTDCLLEHFVATGLRKPLTKADPVAFVVNAQGAIVMQEMLKKYLQGKEEAVDLLIARPMALELERQLYNDTPQQRAMTKLFHLYRILEMEQAKAASQKSASEVAGDWYVGLV